MHTPYQTTTGYGGWDKEKNKKQHTHAHTTPHKRMHHIKRLPDVVVRTKTKKIYIHNNTQTHTS